MNYLCLDFVNSSWFITHRLFYDPLENDAWMKDFLSKWDIGIPSCPDAEILKELGEMRKQLSGMLERLSQGNGLRDTDIDILNSYMAQASFCRQLKAIGDGRQLKDVPAVNDWSWFMCEVAASLAQLSTNSIAKKLKACENPDCRWFFIDESRNSSRKWCDDTCASLMKVRRFRQKRKASV